MDYCNCSFSLPSLNWSVPPLFHVIKHVRKHVPTQLWCQFIVQPRRFIPSNPSQDVCPFPAVPKMFRAKFFRNIFDSVGYLIGNPAWHALTRSRFSFFAETCLNGVTGKQAITWKGEINVCTCLCCRAKRFLIRDSESFRILGHVLWAGIDEQTRFFVRFCGTKTHTTELVFLLHKARKFIFHKRILLWKPSSQCIILMSLASPWLNYHFPIVQMN